MRFTELKRSIVFRLLTIIIASAIMAPTAFKLHHLLTHDQHVVCEGDLDTHFHEKDLDCDFQKYKLSKELFHLVKNQENQVEDSFTLEIYNFYKEQESQSIIHFSLRAPPFIVA